MTEPGYMGPRAGPEAAGSPQAPPDPATDVQPGDLPAPAEDEFGPMRDIQELVTEEGEWAE